jgi:NAD(P)-dependent dehydrogenase (short-subunit alcohol dehydrogenase family)
VKAVLVTGALGGIGRALCAEFAAAGYRVVGTDRAAGSLDSGTLVTTDLRKLVGQAESRAIFVDAVHRALNGATLTTLVNNAAVQILGGTDEVRIEDFQLTLETNLLAPFVLTQMFIDDLSSASGSVINIASVHAVATKPRFVVYATSKAALVGLTKSMAVDLGPRLRVNAILPAAVSTSMLVDSFAGLDEEFGRLSEAHPLRRIAMPREVARAAVFLASDAANFMTGSCLEVDGGIGSRLHDPV